MGSITLTQVDGRIIDIQGDGQTANLKRMIVEGLAIPDGQQKTLPTLLLYDATGLQIFEEITYLEEYYLTGQEIEVLERNADEIATNIEQNSVLLELGSGNLRKVKILLDALERAKRNVTYFALDLMRSELERTLAAVPEGTFKYVKCFGLLGTYDDGLQWLTTPEMVGQTKTIMSLGSSVGNYNRDEAAAFVKQFAGTLGPNSTLLLGLDACQEPKRVYQAYNDLQGVTNRFTINGLNHANKILGYDAFDLNNWYAAGEYSAAEGLHRAHVVPRSDCVVAGIAIRGGERIRIEESVKYSAAQTRKLWDNGDVIEKTVWSNTAGDYHIHMLTRRQNMVFPTNPIEYARHPVPSLDDWHRLWKVWTIVTRQMIPDAELNEKPIKLRNACIFYLGHIPTFMSMKLVEGTGMQPIEPAAYSKIFERGIDPDVDDPAQCHAHSEVPDEWPPVEEISDYQDRVHERVASFYKTGQAYDDAWTGRVLWLGYEHEAMHLETLLYMLLQSDKTLPPTGVPRPEFEQLADKADHEAEENQWFDIPSQTIKTGLDDPERAVGPVRHFGWDVEKPAREETVEAFKAKARPITNGEYAKYLFEIGKDHLPASWSNTGPTDGVNGQTGEVDGHSNGYANGHTDGHTNGTSNHTNGYSGLPAFLAPLSLRTFHGPIPLSLALHHPVSASYDELAGCAAYMGGRIPTQLEAQSIYSHAENLRKQALQTLGANIPAVNAHLINEGVQESPPSHRCEKGQADGLETEALFTELGDSNVGFKHWGTVSVTQDGNKLAGQGGMGGLWEWTCSVLERHEGYEPMELYPAYSSDFFDGKHNVVLGGSWATLPRIAGRRSFVNWYQRNYPYAWATARLVKDI
ncbi:hypothetical protein B0A48_16391 [Cryoendolithus antarcticus]|uniref:Ergothioneine biosynthesis protein 1 n=1 Tax=Cryoendolithus antarcticus TaxID=1507870 RepID=A0A1V8SE75_9PEZI|nr:hypothetical protein B0A48_16391 [Cryoendolithus antarcticus]